MPSQIRIKRTFGTGLPDFPPVGTGVTDGELVYVYDSNNVGAGGTFRKLFIGASAGVSTAPSPIGGQYYMERLPDDLTQEGVLLPRKVLSANENSVIDRIQVGSGLSVSGISTFYNDLRIEGDLTVTDDIFFDEFQARQFVVTGVGTINDGVSIGGTLAVPEAYISTGIITDIQVSGASTVVGDARFESDVYILGDLNVTGDIVYDEVRGRNLNISGVGTITNFMSGLGTITTLDTETLDARDANITGLAVTDIVGTGATITTINNTTLVSTTANITRLTVTNTVGTISTITTLDVNTGDIASANITGLAVTDIVGTAATITTVDVESLDALNANITGLAVTDIVGTAASITTIDVSNLDALSANITGLAVTDIVATAATITAFDADTADLLAANINVGMITSAYINSGFATNFTFSGISTFQSDVHFGDNDSLFFGDGNDLEIFHSGGDSIIRDVGTGRLNLQSDGLEIRLGSTSGEKYAVFSNNGAVELYYNDSLRLDTSTHGINVSGGINVSAASTFQGNVYLGDSDVLNFGDGNDLQIDHNGSSSRIIDTSGTLVYRSASHKIIDTSGTLVYRSASHKIRNQGGTEELATFTENGSVELYYDNSKKFETVDIGANVIGNLEADSLNITGVSTVTGIATFQSDVYIDGNLNITGDVIYDEVNGRNLNISGVGTIANLNVTGVGTITTFDSETAIIDNLQVAGTTTTGQLNVSGVSTFQGNVYLGDSDNLYFGDGGDMRILHNGTDSFIIDQGTGNLNIYGDNEVRIRNTAGTEYKARFITDGAVELYYDNSKKFETTGYGVTIYNELRTPNLNVTGVSTFDGLIDANNGIDVVGTTTVTQLNATGISTFNDVEINGALDIYSPSVLIQNDLLVSGNLSVGGTFTSVNVADLRVNDKDLVLGITTNLNNDDVSNDNTANHGGVAIASTEGTPLVSMTSSGINTLPDTYKQMMWIKGGTYGIGTTDAFVFNYAVGIGSTNVPLNAYAAIGANHIYERRIETPNLTVAENANVIGILTGTTFDSETATIGQIDVAGTSTTGQLNVTGVSTFVGIATFQDDVYIAGNLNVKGDLTYDEVRGRNLSISGVGTIANIEIGTASTNTINTLSGALTLNSEIGFNVAISTHTNVVGYLSATDGIYYEVGDFNGPNGIAYFDSTGLLVSSASTVSAASTSNYLLTTNATGVPVWTNVFEGGSF
jgi:hypothetical protein